MKFKLYLYRFLGKFIPYFKHKIMVIDYYTNNWVFLTCKTYNHTAVPRKDESVVLFVNGQNIIYTVITVRYESDNIKILLQ